MTSAKRKALTWLLTGGAFAMVMMSAGCASRGPGRTTLYEPATRPSIETAAAPMSMVAGDPQAPRVNIWGEFDGASNTSVRSGAGEAAFQQHTFVDEGFDGDVAVDPKGQWLVFSSTRHSEHPDVYLQKVNGLSVTQLTSDEADDAFPSFSPDGTKIAFSSTRSGNWDIFVMDMDGKNVTQITSSTMQEIHPSFSPDGSKLVYSALSGRSGQWELWTVNLSTSEKRMIGYGLFPAWSPTKDKNQIAFQKARARGSRWFSLWTLDLVDGEARNVSEVAVSSNAAIVSPTWSPDGKHLSFSTIVDPAKNVSGRPTGQQDIWVVNADGANRKRITDGNGTSATPFWGSDNRIYFVSNRGGTDCIWSATVEQGLINTGTANAAEHKEAVEHKEAAAEQHKDVAAAAEPHDAPAAHQDAAEHKETATAGADHKEVVEH